MYAFVVVDLVEFADHVNEWPSGDLPWRMRLSKFVAPTRETGYQLFVFFRFGSCSVLEDRHADLGIK